MKIHAKISITKHIQRLNLYTNTTLPMHKSYLSALNDPKWINVMENEFNALIANDIENSFLSPNGVFFFRKRLKMDHAPELYNSWLMKKYKSQRSKIDYDEIRYVCQIDNYIHNPQSCCLMQMAYAPTWCKRMCSYMTFLVKQTICTNNLIFMTKTHGNFVCLLHEIIIWS